MIHIRPRPVVVTREVLITSSEGPAAAGVEKYGQVWRIYGVKRAIGDVCAREHRWELSGADAKVRRKAVAIRYRKTGKRSANLDQGVVVGIAAPIIPGYKELGTVGLDRQRGLPLVGRDAAGFNIHLNRR